MAKKMSEDKKLQQKAMNVLVEADHYNWVHQTNWFGDSFLQLPQDAFAMLDIAFNTNLDHIIKEVYA